jgi:hypothetical protein
LGGRHERAIEIDELTLFLDAYELSQGEPLLIVDAGENPDFVCARANGDSYVLS